MPFHTNEENKTDTQQCQTKEKLTYAARQNKESEKRGAINRLHEEHAYSYAPFGPTTIEKSFQWTNDAVYELSTTFARLVYPGIDIRWFFSESSM